MCAILRISINVYRPDQGPGSVIGFLRLGTVGQSVASKLVRGAGFGVLVHSGFFGCGSLGV